MNEFLTFDSVDLVRSINALDLAPLRNWVTRYANVVMPGAAGTRPYPPVPDELDVDITWRLKGSTHVLTGAPHSDKQVGVEINMEACRTLFKSNADATTGEHDVELHFAGLVLTGDAQVLDYAQVRTGPFTAILITRLLIAAGELTT